MTDRPTITEDADQRDRVRQSEQEYRPQAECGRAAMTTVIEERTDVTILIAEIQIIRIGARGTFRPGC